MFAATAVGVRVRAWDSNGGGGRGADENVMNVGLGGTGDWNTTDVNVSGGVAVPVLVVGSGVRLGCGVPPGGGVLLGGGVAGVPIVGGVDLGVCSVLGVGLGVSLMERVGLGDPLGVLPGVGGVTFGSGVGLGDVGVPSGNDGVGELSGGAGVDVSTPVVADTSGVTVRVAVPGTNVGVREATGVSVRVLVGVRPVSMQNVICRIG